MYYANSLYEVNTQGCGLIKKSCMELKFSSVHLILRMPSKQLWYKKLGFLQPEKTADILQSHH